ncbi:MAG: acyloxyacyl hydrolase [Proteobacteria bacterium]|nr:acyloxyacyl hydrolase [Pseudomonadota bacterium]MDA1354704.1 acyloxyacyl hydrolase [Pseudomonadota bacterium]
MRKSKFARLALVVMLSAALCAGWSMGWPNSARAGEPDFFAFSAGGYDVNDDETAAEFRAEYRSDLRFWKILPFIGLAGTSDEAVYGYAGLGMDIFLGRRVVLQPNAAFVGYHKGKGKDLGGEFQFRTGGEIAWRFDDWSRLAIAFHHISNAGIYDDNPGTELLVLTYSVPFTQAPN